MSSESFVSAFSYVRARACRRYVNEMGEKVAQGRCVASPPLKDPGEAVCDEVYGAPH